MEATNHPTPELLSDEQLSSLETQSQNKSLDYAEVDELLSRIPALCQTVRALRAESEALEKLNVRLTTGLVNIYHVITGEACKHGVALGMATSAVSSMKSENTALREQLAAMERQRNEALDQCTELHRRLAQVEQERSLCLRVQKRGEHSSVICPCIIATERQL